MKMISKNIEDISNGTILLIGETKEPILIYNMNSPGKYGMNLHYKSNWFKPNDMLYTINENTIIDIKWVIKARIRLQELFDIGVIPNLDYIEALAKLKEYELS